MRLDQPTKENPVISREAWRYIHQAARQIQNFTVQDPLHLSRTPEAMHLRMDRPRRVVSDEAIAGGTLRFARIVSAPSASRVLTIQPVKMDSSGAITTDGSTEQVFAWPEAQGRNYSLLVANQGIVMLVFVGGAWFARQDHLFSIDTSTPTTPLGNC